MLSFNFWYFFFKADREKKTQSKQHPPPHFKNIFNADHKGIIPTPPRRWHCLLYNTISSRHGCLALFAPPYRTAQDPATPSHPKLPTVTCHLSSRHKSQKWSGPFQICCHILRSLVSSSLLEHDIHQ